MAQKFIYLFIVSLLFQAPLMASAERVGKKNPQSIFNPSTGVFPLEQQHVDEEAPEFSMQQCLELCRWRHRMAAIGTEGIAAACQRHCEKEHARRLLQSTDLEDKNRGIHQLCLLAEKQDVPELLALLEQDITQRTGIWAEIIPTLGRLEDPRAVPLLSDLVQLDAEDWLGRAMAVQALGEIGDTRTVPVLIHAAWRAETREAAIAALARIDDIRAAPVLVSAIQPEEEPKTQKNAAKGLIRLGPDAVAPIIEELESYSPEDRQQQKRVWLCQILGAMNNPQADRVILELVSDPDPAVRRCAQKALDNTE